MTRVVRTRFLVLLALAASFAAGALLPAFGKSAEGVTVVRNALAQTSTVQGAPNRTMVLSRVKVPSGAVLSLHRHRGTQIARVQSGTLTYTVRSGSVTVRKGEADQDPQVVRMIKAGQRGEISAGEWIVEQPSVIHEATNLGSKAVVLYISTLLETGAPPSTPVTPSG